MTKIQLLIWDCDGVLVDSETLLKKSEAESLTKAGYEVTVEDCIRLFSGYTCENAEKNFNNKYGKLPDNFFSNQINKSIQLFKDKLTPLNYNTVKNIAINTKLIQCIASGSPKNRVKTCLEVTNMKQYFKDEYIFAKEDVKQGKPSPDIYLHAAKMMGYSSSNCLVVEDTCSGIKSALNAGMEVIAFLGGNHTKSTWYRDKIFKYNIPIFENENQLQEYIFNRIE